MVHMPQEPLLTSKEAAALLGCSHWTVNRRAVDGSLVPAHVTPRGERLFRRRDVERFALRRRAKRAA